ncbi:MAG TPA: RNA 2',3'-cyclic phosphodiesterase, partial [Promineifilum sp.]|nr:RNA 2',3'-cyclic phosphodiesterase [Promineifilum sp.]
MAVIRAFIAVQLPVEVKEALGNVSRTLDSQVTRGAVRWVRPEQMHLTLRFLGDTDVQSLPAVQAALDAVATGYKPFTLQLEGIGCFPNARRPRVIWVGLAGDESRLHALKTALDEQLASLGLPPEDKP